MSRKEQLKKSLGISEYPWSSDDEDSGNQVTDVPLLRRQPPEPRPSVADIPGTSGQQPPTSPTLSPARRSKAEVYWSFMNKPAHNCSSSCSSRSRLSEMQPTGEARERERGAARAGAAAADIRRILAFKKLTRTIGSMHSKSRPNANLYSMSSRGLAGPSRNPIFTPNMSTSEVTPSSRASRVHNALRRLQTAYRSNMVDYGTRSLNTAPVSGSMSFNDLLMRAGSDVMDTPVTADPIVVPDSPVVERPEEVIPAVPDVSASTPLAEPIRVENLIVDQETINVDVSHNTSGTMSLEEEIVEIDAPDETDANDSATDPAGVAVNADVGLNEIETVNANGETEALPQQTENAKRRLEANMSPDDTEPYTVKEFNQSLLRLLECPVCLEWMEPPMSQCRRGHLVCSRCRARLSSCPVCRTTFSSVRNRAMEGVAEMVRYPCRHGCGREVRLRRRAAHEASCGARRYQCPAPACAARAPLPRDLLPQHFQSKHMAMLKIGRKHKFSMKVNSEQHDTWLIAALHEYFSLRVDVDIRTWGVIVYVAYIGPKCNASNFIYEVSVVGQHNSRKLVYARATHSDLESSSLNVSRQDCFHLTLDQALNFLRIKNRHCEPDKFLDFNVEISKSEVENRDDSDS